MECLFCHIYSRVLCMELMIRRSWKGQKIRVQIMQSIRIMNWFNRKFCMIWWCFTKQVYQISFLYFFHIVTICLFCKIENITLRAFCFCQHHILSDFGSLIIMAVCLTNSIWMECIIVSSKVSSRIAFLSRTLVLLDILTRLFFRVGKPSSSMTLSLCTWYVWYF